MGGEGMEGEGEGLEGSGGGGGVVVVDSSSSQHHQQDSSVPSSGDSDVDRASKLLSQVINLTEVNFGLKGVSPFLDGGQQLQEHGENPFLFGDEEGDEGGGGGGGGGSAAAATTAAAAAAILVAEAEALACRKMRIRVLKSRLSFFPRSPLLAWNSEFEGGGVEGPWSLSPHSPPSHATWAFPLLLQPEWVGYSVGNKGVDDGKGGGEGEESSSPTALASLEDLVHSLLEKIEYARGPNKKLYFLQIAQGILPFLLEEVERAEGGRAAGDGEEAAAVGKHALIMLCKALHFMGGYLESVAHAKGKKREGEAEKEEEEDEMVTVEEPASVLRVCIIAVFQCISHKVMAVVGEEEEKERGMEETPSPATPPSTPPFPLLQPLAPAAYLSCVEGGRGHTTPPAFQLFPRAILAIPSPVTMHSWILEGYSALWTHLLSWCALLEGVQQRQQQQQASPPPHPPLFSMDSACIKGVIGMQLLQLGADFPSLLHLPVKAIGHAAASAHALAQVGGEVEVVVEGEGEGGEEGAPPPKKVSPVIASNPTLFAWLTWFHSFSNPLLPWEALGQLLAHHLPRLSPPSFTTFLLIPVEKRGGLLTPPPSSCSGSGGGGGAQGKAGGTGTKHHQTEGGTAPSVPQPHTTTNNNIAPPPPLPPSKPALSMASFFGSKKPPPPASTASSSHAASTNPIQPQPQQQQQQQPPPPTKALPPPPPPLPMKDKIVSEAALELGWSILLALCEPVGAFRPIGEGARGEQEGGDTRRGWRAYIHGAQGTVGGGGGGAPPPPPPQQGVTVPSPGDASSSLFKLLGESYPQVTSLECLAARQFSPQGPLVEGLGEDARQGEVNRSEVSGRLAASVLGHLHSGMGVELSVVEGEGEGGEEGESEVVMGGEGGEGEGGEGEGGMYGEVYERLSPSLTTASSSTATGHHPSQGDPWSPAYTALCLTREEVEVWHRTPNAALRAWSLELLRGTLRRCETWWERGVMKACEGMGGGGRVVSPGKTAFRRYLARLGASFTPLFALSAPYLAHFSSLHPALHCTLPKVPKRFLATSCPSLLFPIPPAAPPPTTSSSSLYPRQPFAASAAAAAATASTPHPAPTLYAHASPYPLHTTWTYAYDPQKDSRNPYRPDDARRPHFEPLSTVTPVLAAALPATMTPPEESWGGEHHMPSTALVAHFPTWLLRAALEGGGVGMGGAAAAAAAAQGGNKSTKALKTHLYHAKGAWRAWVDTPLREASLHVGAGVSLSGLPHSLDWALPPTPPPTSGGGGGGGSRGGGGASVSHLAHLGEVLAALCCRAVDALTGRLLMLEMEGGEGCGGLVAKELLKALEKRTSSGAIKSFVILPCSLVQPTLNHTPGGSSTPTLRASQPFLSYVPCPKGDTMAPQGAAAATTSSSSSSSSSSSTAVIQGAVTAELQRQESLMRVYSALLSSRAALEKRLRSHTWLRATLSFSLLYKALTANTSSLAPLLLSTTPATAGFMDVAASDPPARQLYSQALWALHTRAVKEKGGGAGGKSGGLLPPPPTLPFDASLELSRVCAATVLDLHVLKGAQDTYLAASRRGPSSSSSSSSSSSAQGMGLWGGMKEEGISSPPLHEPFAPPHPIRPMPLDAFFPSSLSPAGGAAAQAHQPPPPPPSYPPRLSPLECSALKDGVEAWYPPGMPVKAFHEDRRRRALVSLLAVLQTLAECSIGESGAVLTVGGGGGGLQQRQCLYGSLWGTKWVAGEGEGGGVRGASAGGGGGGSGSGLGGALRTYDRHGTLRLLPLSPRLALPGALRVTLDLFQREHPDSPSIVRVHVGSIRVIHALLRAMELPLLTFTLSRSRVWERLRVLHEEAEERVPQLDEEGFPIMDEEAAESLKRCRREYAECVSVGGGVAIDECAALGRAFAAMEGGSGGGVSSLSPLSSSSSSSSLLQVLAVVEECVVTCLSHRFYVGGTANSSSSSSSSSSAQATPLVLRKFSHRRALLHTPFTHPPRMSLLNHGILGAALSTPLLLHGGNHLGILLAQGVRTMAWVWSAGCARGVMVPVGGGGGKGGSGSGSGPAVAPTSVVSPLLPFPAFLARYACPPSPSVPQPPTSDATVRIDPAEAAVPPQSIHAHSLWSAAGWLGAPAAAHRPTAFSSSSSSSSSAAGHAGGASRGGASHEDSLTVALEEVWPTLMSAILSTWASEPTCNGGVRGECDDAGLACEVGLGVALGKGDGVGKGERNAWDGLAGWGMGFLDWGGGGGGSGGGVLPLTHRPGLIIHGSVRDGFLGARLGSHSYQRALLSAFACSLAGEVKGESEGGGEGLIRKRILEAAREHRVTFASAIAWLLATHASKESWKPPGNLKEPQQIAMAWSAHGGFILRCAWEGGASCAGGGAAAAAAPGEGSSSNPRDASASPRVVCARLKAGVEGLKSIVGKAPAYFLPAAKFRGAALDKVWVGVEGLLLG